MPLTILFTGNYDPGYNRTAVIRAGLLKLGHRVEEFPFKKRNGAARVKLLKFSKNADFIFMPSFTHKEVPFVKKNSSGKKLIFDPLVSRYMTKALDYKKVFKYGLAALINRYYDRKSMSAADSVITDTLAHLEYFNSAFGIPKSKMEVIRIGNDFGEFFTENAAGTVENRKSYLVGFYGGFIPLQGVMNILKAAALLKGRKDIFFRLIGNGFDYKKARSFAEKEKLEQVSFPGWIGRPGLRLEIQAFDAALGVFGETPKTELVIPNKIYHYAACRKPIITKDTRAVRELFADKKDLLLVDGSPASIAEAVLRLKNDPAEAGALALSAYSKIKENFDETKTAERLIDIFVSLR